MTSDDVRAPEDEGVTLLLDANVLIAAVVIDHVHHEAVERSIAATEAPFAACIITELALMRFLVREGTSATHAAAVLAAVTRHPRHRSWPADLPAPAVAWVALPGHRQVNDAYLAALARGKGVLLTTLDRGMAAAHPDVAELVDARLRRPHTLRGYDRAPEPVRLRTCA